jgi:hypothetical protein
VPFDPSSWRFRPQSTATGETVARLEQRFGRQSLFIRNGHVTFGDVSFADGTIEVDVAVPRDRTFTGILFRAVSGDDYEDVYIRPHKSGLDDALQYHAVFDGSSTWQLYNGPGFTGAIEIPREQWCRLRVVFSGLQARVYFNDFDRPVLEIAELKRAYAKGGIGLWAGPGGAWFSNLRYERAGEERPPVAAPQVTMPPGIVKTWEISDAMDAEGELPASLPRIDKWQSVSVEPPGKLVIDRYRKSAGTLPPSFRFSQRLGTPVGRRIVYARAVVQSDQAQTKKMSFGYSDEVCVFLNGRVLFTGRGPWRFRDETFLGIMDVEGDALHVPLEKGRNEIVMAVAEFFGGWGLIVRFDDPRGLTLP